MSRQVRHVAAVLAAGCFAVLGCASESSDDGVATTAVSAATTDATATPSDGVEELFPDILAVEVTGGDGVYTVSATMSSPYDTPERYADAFRVLTPDGAELGVRVLAHDHANEQPFTRSLLGVEIPPGVDEIVVEGRDQLSGWGGATVTAAVPGG